MKIKYSSYSHPFTHIHTLPHTHANSFCMLAEKRCRPFKCQEPTLSTIFVSVALAGCLAAISLDCWQAFLMHGYYRITLSLAPPTSVGVAKKAPEQSALTFAFVSLLSQAQQTLCRECERESEEANKPGDRVRVRERVCASVRVASGGRLLSASG